MSHARTAIGVAALVLAASGCTSESTPRAKADITVEGHKRTISSNIQCTTEPGESGDRTTHITASNALASVDLSLSDAMPPMVNGFALALSSEPDAYRIPYQTVKKASDVHANRDGKSYKVSGTGNGTKPGPKPPTKPGQSDLQEIKFQVLVVCP